MIEVRRYDGGIQINGHAGYAEVGKDIVCAGVSALVQTLVRSLEALTTDTIEYSISPGTADINFRNLSECAHILVDSFFIGVRMIAEEYPHYITLV